jgi:hypothetical protein
MDHRNRIAGIAALIEAATFVFGIVMFATVMSDYTTGDPTPAESVAFVADNQVALYVWNSVILILFGIVLVPLALALHDRLKSGSPALAQTATAFGLIWAGLVIAAGMITNIGLGTVADLNDTDPAAAEPVWSALDSVENGLGGGNEIAGGIWVLLVSVAALRAGLFSKAVNYLGIVSGVAGLVTIIPPLEVVGAVFGIGLIVWFTWIGIVMIREDSGAAATSSSTASPTPP